jgi:hypothetical protein
MSDIIYEYSVGKFDFYFYQLRFGKKTQIAISIDMQTTHLRKCIDCSLLLMLKNKQLWYIKKDLGIRK